MKKKSFCFNIEKTKIKQKTKFTFDLQKKNEKKRINNKNLEIK